MRVAYADPPYIGCAAIYRDHPDFAGEVDHAALIVDLERGYPDGWALSAKSTSLRDLLPLAPSARVLIWAKTYASFHKGVSPTYAWEPVIVRGGRKPDVFLHDWHASAPAMVKGFTGAKPESFCHWLFRCLGLADGDELVDLFPGSGAVSRAWDSYRRQLTIGPLADRPGHSQDTSQDAATLDGAWDTADGAEPLGHSQDSDDPQTITGSQSG